ncbi:hypothetical protein [Promicromonospora panici]|uniref:hypothetical protein n=1 Tax=Promicromonospora panici TaxID=2219658 RepID=UPI00101D1D38|nr:hypothetical protein [Promicromonospora panici]
MIFRLTGALALSACVSTLVLSTPQSSRMWAWVLTGLQVLALWAAGRHHSWAWLVGGGVQPVWIAYAVATGQWGFVPGCLASGAVQVRNYLLAVDSDHTPHDGESTDERRDSRRSDQAWRPALRRGAQDLERSHRSPSRVDRTVSRRRGRHHRRAVRA